MFDGAFIRLRRALPIGRCPLINQGRAGIALIVTECKIYSSCMDGVLTQPTTDYVRYRTVFCCKKTIFIAWVEPISVIATRDALTGDYHCMKPLSKPEPTHTAQFNELLAALPDDEWRRWEPELEFVDLPLGRVLYESGGKLSHVYFPTTAIVSLLYVLENGASAEIAVVGREGLVGMSIFMGGESTLSRGVVQSAGQGYRLRSALLKDEFKRSGPVMHLLLRYTQALITQMAQTAVCNRHHSLDQQLCRWLLLSLDRLEGNDLVMTQELIANMLGVRREGVTEAALKLQKAGLIQYARGRITVLDRPGLEARSCECYAVVKKECGRLLPVRLAT